MTDITVCHRAPWLVTGRPGETGPLADGAVVVAHGRIVALGRYAECRGLAGKVVDHQGCVLVPPLVNGHTHLELSHLSELGKGEGAAGDLPGWIASLLGLRAERAASGAENASRAHDTLAQLHCSGCGLVADIGNEPASALFGNASPVAVLFFQEVLGSSRAGEERGLALLDAATDDLFLTGHAPYSVAPGLLRKLKERARRLGHLFSIHLAESTDEVALLNDGRGGFPELFRKLGVWDGSFKVPGTSPVAYLDRLGVVDANTLCVHCVQVDDDDIAVLARRGARVCLCPGSNRFLGVGRPPVERMVAAGILPALGTDSLASNPVLSLWREMGIVRQEHPAIPPATVFAMASRGGAQALGYGETHGRLAVGRPAAMLSVSCPAVGQGEVLEFLTTVGDTAAVSWL